jgi:hypothetical protein
MLKRAIVVLALLCAIATLGVCQTKNDRGAKGSGGQGANQHSEADKNQQHTTSPLPNGIVVINNQNSSPEHDAHANQTDEELAKFTWYLVLVGALQLVALVVQAVVFYFTLRQIGKQADIMEQHRTSLEELARAAGDNAKAALLNAQAVINAERAWIQAGPDMPDFDLDDLTKGKALFNWFINNTGRTPARIEKVAARYILIKSFGDIPADPKSMYIGDLEEIPHKGRLLFPNERFWSFEFLEPSNPTPEQVTDIREGKRTLFAIGYVRYLDVVSKDTPPVPHVTNICYYYFVPQGDLIGVKAGWRPCLEAPSAYHEAT